jgi:hypothetical protein
MLDPMKTQVRQVTWEQGRQQQREEWARMSMEDRLRNSATVHFGGLTVRSSRRPT